MGWTLVIAGVFLAGVGVIKALDVYQNRPRMTDPWPDVHQPTHVRKVRPGDQGWADLQADMFDQDGEQ